MKVFEATIEINAPIDIVWQFLADFSSYPDWNPFIVWAEGALDEGANVNFKVAGQSINYKAEIVTVKPQAELTWIGQVPLPGVHPRYIRIVESLGENRTRFSHRDEFSGWLVPLIAPVLNLQFSRFYVPTCEALKQHAETVYHQRQGDTT